MILKGYIFALLWGIFCVILSALCFKMGMKKSLSRKIVHILVGFEWVILYIFHGVSLHFVAVCIGFTCLLLVEYRMKLLPMMSSDGDNAPGTVYYGISMTLMAVASLIFEGYIFAFAIAVFATSCGDGFAGVIGSLIKKNNPKIYKNKTLFGAISNFVITLVGVIVISNVFVLNIKWYFAVGIALLAVGLELLGQRGLDNILLPLGVGAFTFFVIRAPELAVSFALPIILTPYIIVVVNQKNILTNLGILAALTLDFVISVAFGNMGFLVLLLFLFLSVVVDKIKSRAKFRRDIGEKGDKRDECQVLANGLVAMFMALFFLVDKGSLFIVAYCASLSEAFADTCASGFGAFSKKTYDIFRFKPTENGMSGGMSLIGTLSSLISAAALALVPLAFSAVELKGYLIIVLCAFAGCLFDSLLGSLVQAKYRCVSCGALTEKRTHCESQTHLHAGVRFITNDTVNLLSTLFSALLAIALCVVL